MDYFGILDLEEGLQKMQNQLRVKRLSETAQLPKTCSSGAAGFDLFADNENVVTIPPHGKALIPTNISIAVPIGYYGRIAPRSSLAWKHHIDVGAGVIDSDYRGPVGIVLFNLSNDTSFDVQHGDRVAQLILERIVLPEIVDVQDLDNTARGAGGFGSTGK